MDGWMDERMDGRIAARRILSLTNLLCLSLVDFSIASRPELPRDRLPRSVDPSTFALQCYTGCTYIDWPLRWPCILD